MARWPPWKPPKPKCACAAELRMTNRLLLALCRMEIDRQSRLTAGVVDLELVRWLDAVEAELED